MMVNVTEICEQSTTQKKMAHLKGRTTTGIGLWIIDNYTCITSKDHLAELLSRLTFILFTVSSAGSLR
jgi:hypothetical protein